MRTDCCCVPEVAMQRDMYWNADHFMTGTWLGQCLHLVVSALSVISRRPDGDATGNRVHPWKEPRSRWKHLVWVVIRGRARERHVGRESVASLAAQFAFVIATATAWSAKGVGRRDWAAWATGAAGAALAVATDSFAIRSYVSSLWLSHECMRFQGFLPKVLHAHPTHVLRFHPCIRRVGWLAMLQQIHALNGEFFEMRNKTCLIKYALIPLNSCSVSTRSILKILSR